jgi:hypothetical protein
MWPVYLVILWFVLALLVPPIWSTGRVYLRAHGCRNVKCPGRQDTAIIRPDALYAIRSNLLAEPRWRVENCTLWPEQQCEQECLAQLEVL